MKAFTQFEFDNAEEQQDFFQRFVDASATKGSIAAHATAANTHQAAAAAMNRASQAWVSAAANSTDEVGRRVAQNNAMAYAASAAAHEAAQAAHFDSARAHGMKWQPPSQPKCHSTSSQTARTIQPAARSRRWRKSPRVV